MALTILPIFNWIGTNSLIYLFYSYFLAKKTIINDVLIYIIINF